MPTPETTDPAPTSAAEEQTLGELLRELRTVHAKVTPQRANALLKLGLRQKLFYQGEALIQDLERDNSFPEPMALVVYLEALKAPPELLARIEAALKAAIERAGAVLASPRVEPGRVAVSMAAPPSSLSWQREQVRLAAEELRRKLIAVALVERALRDSGRKRVGEGP